MVGNLKKWKLAVLTGDRINEDFLIYKRMYGRFTGPKSGRNNEVTVLTGWP